MRPALCSNAIHKKTVNSDKSEVAAITSAAKGPSPPICSAIGNEDTAVGTQKMAKRETKAVVMSEENFNQLAMAFKGLSKDKGENRAAD